MMANSYFCSMNFTLYPRGLFLVFLAVLLNQNMQAQYFRTGIDPIGIRWEQINEKGFRLLFPKGFDEQAILYQNLVVQGIPAIGASLDHFPRKFPLVIHSFSAVSNGYTIWAPRRIELFPRPPVIGAAESYTDHLLIHELRHMIQMDKLNTGLTRLAGYGLGDQAVAAVVGLHVPSWLTEGDAVLSETLLSNSGRGRQASFIQDLRVLWLQGDFYSYEKATFGSYKDYVPNHYVLGYHMVSMGRLLGEPLIWAKGLDKIGRKPLQASILSRHLKKEIGLNRNELYAKTREWFSSYWRNQAVSSINQPKIFHADKEADYQDYIKPIFLGNGQWLALRNSIGQIPEFVIFNDQDEEKHVLYPGVIERGSFTAKGGQLVWAELQSDMRWSNRSYSNLFGYDLVSQKKRVLSRNKRFFSPELNQSGTLVAALEYLPKGLNELVILDAFSGQEMDRVAAPNETIFDQLFLDEDDLIWLFITGRNGKSIVSYDVNSHALNEIYHLGYKEANSLTRIDRQLFFTAPHGSVNAVYSLNLDDQKLFLVSVDPYGIQHLSPMGDQITASVYSLHGYRPALVSQLKSDHSVSQLPDLDEPVTPLIKRAPLESPLQIKPVRDSSRIRPYPKALHWFKFHSWAPVSLDLSEYSLLPGLMLLSQNDLSTAQMNLGIEYNLAQKRIEYRAGLNFVLGYPEVQLSLRSYQDRNSFTKTIADTVSTLIDYHFYSANANLSVPLNFSEGRWNKGLVAALMSGYNTYRGASADSGDDYINTIAAVGVGLKAYSYSRTSLRDLYPRLGASVSLTTYAVVDYFRASGRTHTSGAVQAYLPGFLENHSTRIYLGALLNNDWFLPDQNPLWLPRGLYNFSGPYTTSGKLDYAFPFAYPDWKLGRLLYVKRLKANLFCDAALDYQKSAPFFLSTGIDLTSDFYLLGIGAEIDSGIRTIYNAFERKFSFELLFDFAID